MKKKIAPPSLNAVSIESHFVLLILKLNAVKIMKMISIGKWIVHFTIIMKNWNYNHILIVMIGFDVIVGEWNRLLKTIGRIPLTVSEQYQSNWKGFYNRHFFASTGKHEIDVRLLNPILDHCWNSVWRLFNEFICVIFITIIYILR